MQDPDRQNPNANGQTQTQRGRRPLRSAAVQWPDQAATQRARQAPAMSNVGGQSSRITTEGEKPQAPLGDYMTQRSGTVPKRGLLK